MRRAAVLVAGFVLCTIVIPSCGGHHNVDCSDRSVAIANKITARYGVGGRSRCEYGQTYAVLTAGSSSDLTALEADLASDGWVPTTQWVEGDTLVHPSISTPEWEPYIAIDRGMARAELYVPD